MKCIENISLEIKVFKSLFIQLIDGLNFGHIYDDYVTIWKCLSKSRRIFLKASIPPGFQGQQSGDQSSPREFVGGAKKLTLEYMCNSVEQGVIRILQSYGG